ncbi:unnamed protein product, partial [Pylaiella littoralis]
MLTPEAAAGTTRTAAPSTPATLDLAEAEIGIESAPVNAFRAAADVAPDTLSGKTIDDGLAAAEATDCISSNDSNNADDHAATNTASSAITIDDDDGDDADGSDNAATTGDDHAKTVMADNDNDDDDPNVADTSGDDSYSSSRIRENESNQAVFELRAGAGV